MMELCKVCERHTFSTQIYMIHECKNPLSPSYIICAYWRIQLNKKTQPLKFSTFQELPPFKLDFVISIIETRVKDETRKTCTTLIFQNKTKKNWAMILAL